MEETKDKKGVMLDESFVESIFQNETMGLILEEGEAFRELMAYYECAIMEVETKFNVLNKEFSLRYDRNPIETIKSRLKSPESIMGKLQRKKIPFSAEEIEDKLMDIAGVRVICAFPEDIYLLRDCLLKQDDIELLVEKDYIANPKPNGYRSLHLIVETPIFLHDQKKLMKVEVQFRTIAMDFWASLEHQLRYKSDVEIPEHMSDDLKKCADVIAETDQEMQRIAKELKVL